jgi:hypothetical protein
MTFWILKKAEIIATSSAWCPVVSIVVMMSGADGEDFGRGFSQNRALL